MAYDRSITVTGKEIIEEKEVIIFFSYTEGNPPTNATFSSNNMGGLSVNGNCSLTKIENYSVYGGVVTDEFMRLVAEKCITALIEYDTI